MYQTLPPSRNLAPEIISTFYHKIVIDFLNSEHFYSALLAVKSDLKTLTTFSQVFCLKLQRLHLRSAWTATALERVIVIRLIKKLYAARETECQGAGPQVCEQYESNSYFHFEAFLVPV